MATSFVLTLDIFAKHAVIVQHGAIISFYARGEAEIQQKLTLLSIHKYIQIVNLTAVGGSVLLDSAASCLGIDLRDMTKEGKDRYETPSWQHAVDESHEFFLRLAYEFRPFIAGGIRTSEMALSYLSHSARRVVSSRAEVLLSLSPDIAMNRTILSVDLDENGRLLMHGRSETSDQTLESLLSFVSGRLKKVTVTFHENEGTGLAPNFATVMSIQSLCLQHHLSLTIAGGASLEFMRLCLAKNISVQLGKLLHSGQVTIGELMVELLHPFFSPSSNDNNNDDDAMIHQERLTNKIIDVVICQTGIGPLSLVHMSASSLQTSIDSRVLTLYSKSRDKIWTKGATSGNTFHVQKLLINCEKNSLLAYVKPVNGIIAPFCHTGHISCFGDVGPQQASLDHWLDVIIDKQARGELSVKSNNFLSNDVLLRHKIREESEEILFSRNIHESTCELADLIYFLMLFMINQGISMDRLQVEMLSRHFTPSTSLVESKVEMESNIVRLAVTDRISFTDISHALRCNVESYKGRSLHISCDNQSLNCFLIKPKDVYLYLNEDRFEGVICFSDLVKDLNLPLYEACPPFGPIVRICVIAREAEPVNPKLIYSEFYGLANEWRKKQQAKFPKLKLRHTHGKTESLLIAGHCDLAVVTVDSGETLQANNLHIIDTIMVSQACVFVALKAMSRFQHALHV